MKYHAIKALRVAIVATTAGCSKTDLPTHYFDTAAIHHAATTLTLPSSRSIPDTNSWPSGLIQAKPLRFYRDRVNLAIVLTDQPSMKETGLYVHVVHSSYSPRSDSEWNFHHLGDGVYQYERKK